MKTGKSWILMFLLLMSLVISGCVNPEVETSSKAWMDMTLKDVRTGDNFKISDFKGKPVLLESFAVWCPTCIEQQKQTKKLALKVGDDIIHVSLDTDPNEDEEIVREHVETNGFMWYYAVSPIELTQALIDDFGIKIVNAPGVPMVLICPDQSTRLLKSGVKFPDELISEVESGC